MEPKPGTVDNLTFAPPDDNHFQLLVGRAIKGAVPVFGVVLQALRIKARRSCPTHRPETPAEGLGQRQPGALILPFTCSQISRGFGGSAPISLGFAPLRAKSRDQTCGGTPLRLKTAPTYRSIRA